MIHDGQGHQGADMTITLCQEYFCWHPMYKDTVEYVHNCLNFKMVKGHYRGPDTQPSSLISIILWTHCASALTRLTQ